MEDWIWLYADSDLMTSTWAIRKITNKHRKGELILDSLLHQRCYQLDLI
jgi:hypothetical protein